MKGADRNSIKALMTRRAFADNGMDEVFAKRQNFHLLFQ